MFTGDSLGTFRMRSNQVEWRWPWESKNSGAKPLTMAVAISRFKSAFGDGSSESGASDERRPAADHRHRHVARRSRAEVLAGIVGKVTNSGCVGGKLVDRRMRREIRQQQIGPPLALAAECEKIFGLIGIAVRRDDQRQGPPLDVQMGGENIAGDRARFVRRMSGIVVRPRLRSPRG